jgi:hypothetical protein
MLKDLRNARKGRGRRREEEEMNRQPHSIGSPHVGGYAF